MCGCSFVSGVQQFATNEHQLVGLKTRWGMLFNTKIMGWDVLGGGRGLSVGYFSFQWAVGRYRMVASTHPDDAALADPLSSPAGERG